MGSKFLSRFVNSFLTPTWNGRVCVYGFVEKISSLLRTLRMMKRIRVFLLLTTHINKPIKITQIVYFFNKINILSLLAGNFIIKAKVIDTSQSANNIFVCKKSRSFLLRAIFIYRYGTMICLYCFQQIAF
jgi:hypothetical protein